MEDRAESRRQVIALMDDLGFKPIADQELDRIRLTRCPLLQAARANEAVVCSMHQGLVEGALAGYGAKHEVVTLLPFAEPGACLLDLGRHLP
jgi:predicted ArsR family transcriptional regulator